MQLFIGYGYNPRDAWVEELVFPLVETLGWDVVHGKATYGGEIAPELKTMLLSCDAMIGFLTRRDPTGEVWSTHRWVIEELACGFGQLPAVEVREEGVDPQNGMLAGMQRIQYKESERDKCLVQIAQALNRILSPVNRPDSGLRN